MCGRINIYAPEKIKSALDELGTENYPLNFQRYNITPGTFVPVVHNASTISAMPWGIEFGDFRHPNTKVETLKRKPLLQKLLLEQRCLVPINRFYEWPDPKVRPKYQGVKIRFCIHTPEDVMFLGGIYKLNDEGMAQFNVLTTDPTEQIADFHHRMPVIIHPANYKAWFNAETLDGLYPLMNPYTQELKIYPCSQYVNDGRHEGPKCMEPLEE